MYNKLRIRNYMKKYLLHVEAMMIRESFNIVDDSWKDDEDKLVDEIFNDWEDK